MPKASGNATARPVDSILPPILADLKEKYRQRGQAAAWDVEEDSWQTILRSLVTDPGGIGFNYRLDRVLGVGGAGAVFRVLDLNLYNDLSGEGPTSEPEQRRRSFRALKVPRPHVQEGPTLADSLRAEVGRLTILSHRNVIRLVAKGEIPFSLPSGTVTWPWYIMQYLHQATDLNELCERTPPPLPDLIRYLRDTVRGVVYIHANGVIHCDIKPHNIFLPAGDDKRQEATAILADFGYAKHLADDPALTTVGFTEYFAHPDLVLGSLPSTQGSRKFKELPRHDLREEYDLFALGTTIYYLLDRFYRRFSVYAAFGYEIKYLTLSAARLIDGLNEQKDINYGRLPAYCYRDIGTPGTAGFVPGIRYRKAAHLLRDLDKLCGDSTPELEVPELLETRRENIQVSDAAPTVYTKRLRRLVDHPLVRRLASTTQLGLVSLVYPGATHSRLEHALGTVGITAKYLRSLYYDTLDPLFRQLVDTPAMKATLVAALLHDLGQYPLAHDLEDVSIEFFSHERFGIVLLSPTRDTTEQSPLFPELERDGVALSRDFANLLREEWGLDLATITALLGASSSEEMRTNQSGSHVQRLCKSLIDGPIDADKVDYLQRDSRHCNVQYGFGIDTGRLFRCLTVAAESMGDDHLLLVMGVHEKGRIAAESILFVRYAMLTQVYWHHTMRALKALLHHAAAELLNSIESDQFAARRDEFFRCAVLEEPIANREWKDRVSRGRAVASIHGADLRVLGWLWERSTETGRQAIEHILDRSLFKRLLVVYRSELSAQQRRTLEKVYQPDRYDDRCRLRQAVERALLVRLQGADPPDGLLETCGFSGEQWSERLQNADRLRCLVDYPAPRRGASFGLQVVRQWGERPPLAGGAAVISPLETQPTVIQTDNFRDGMKELEKSMACLRIYWHPEEQFVLKETLGDSVIQDVVLDEIARFRPRERSSD